MSMSEIKIPYTIGGLVFFKNDEEQKEYFITGIIIRKTGIVLELSHCGYETTAYDFEVSTERNILITLGLQSE